MKKVIVLAIALSCGFPVLFSYAGQAKKRPINHDVDQETSSPEKRIRNSDFQDNASCFAEKDFSCHQQDTNKSNDTIKDSSVEKAEENVASVDVSDENLKSLSENLHNSWDIYKKVEQMYNQVFEDDPSKVPAIFENVIITNKLAFFVVFYGCGYALRHKLPDFQKKMVNKIINMPLDEKNIMEYFNDFCNIFCESHDHLSKCALINHWSDVWVGVKLLYHFVRYGDSKFSTSNYDKLQFSYRKYYQQMKDYSQGLKKHYN